MNRFMSLSIRTYLVIFITLLALPSVALIVYSGLAARKAAIDDANKQCLEVVNSLAGEQQAVVAGAEQLVTTLALLPEVQARNSTATNALLRDLLKKNPRYANIVIGDASGSVWASAVPFQGNLSMADRRYYQEAIRTGTFSSGEYGVGRAGGKPMMSFGYPVKNADNKVIAVIGVALDLEYAQRTFEKINLPPGSSFGILDHQGIILIRNRQDPFSEKLIGKRDSKQENFTPMTGGAPGGTFKAIGNDGIFRLAAYRKMTLPHESAPYLYVRSSIPLASATATANAAMVKNLTLLAVLYAIGLVLVWFIGKRLIVNPVTRLMKASEQLAAGAGNVRISRDIEGRELGRLARSFDTMADTLAQRESALRESEQRWATTLASIGDAVIATDTDGRISFMNSVAEELTGWTQKDAALRPIAEVFHIINEQTRKEVDSPVSRVLREGIIVGLANHTILVRRDGTELPIDDSGAPIQRVDGKTTGVVLVFRDITERQAAEEALRQSDERFRLALRNAPVSVAVQDRDLRYIWAYNQRTARPEEIIGRRDEDIFTPEEAARVDAIKRRVLEEGVEYREQMWFNRAGGPIFLDVYWEPMHDETGRVIGVGSATVDLTPTKLAEEALRKAHDELEERVKQRTTELQSAYDNLTREIAEREQAEAQLRQAQKMEALGTLSGGIAHDFNNILAAIIGFTELVAERATPGSRDEHHLHRVLEASLRGRELVKQMLTFTRSTAQEKKPLLLSSILKETARMLRATTPTTISIKVNILSESGLILADPTQIQQIVMNLCTNATYAMREKGGILDIELTDFSVARSNGNNHGMEPGLYMKLVVRDTGRGITPDIMDKIFDPFFTTKKLGEGTGLGLSVVHGIVKRSGGYITVESAPGKGSTFTVYFPKIAGEQKTAAPGLDMIPTGSERILFVDDEEAIVEMGEDILAELGYEVTSRTSSKTALALLQENPSRFDLVITDQTMPDMTGVELARHILALRPDIPIILCTGFSHMIDAEGARAAGIRAFAMKPLTKREIATTIRKVLDEPAA